MTNSNGLTKEQLDLITNHINKEFIEKNKHLPKEEINSILLIPISEEEILDYFMAFGERELKKNIEKIIITYSIKINNRIFQTEFTEILNNNKLRNLNWNQTYWEKI